VIRPGPVTVVERIAHAREEARRETFDRLADEFTDQRCADLDNLLVNDPAIGTTRLRWLATGPVEAAPAAVKAEVAKFAFLRGLDAHTLDLSVLPAERRRFLATVGRRLTAQALQRREPQRRYPDPVDVAGAVGDRRAGRGCAVVRPGRLSAGEQGRAQDARRVGRAWQGRGGPAGPAGRDSRHRRRPGDPGRGRRRADPRREGRVGANCITLWNTVYLDRIIQQLRDCGFEVRDEDVARLSPYMHAHINVHGHYSFTPLNLEAGIGNRPLRDPATEG
jgi:hypothetical protein